MFLSLNKKNLKELSNSKITLSATYMVKGAGTGDNTDTDHPSKTATRARCALEQAQKISN